MRVGYLVDTDWAIQYLRGDAGIVGRLEELKPEGLGLSVISLAELYEGVFSSRDPRASEEGLNNFLRRVVLIGIDEDLQAVWSGAWSPARRPGSHGSRTRNPLLIQGMSDSPQDFRNDRFPD